MTNYHKEWSTGVISLCLEPGNMDLCESVSEQVSKWEAEDIICMSLESEILEQHLYQTPVKKLSYYVSGGKVL